MINSFEAKIQALSIHQVGNKNEEEGVQQSEESITIQDETLHELLLHYFFSHFEQPEFYAFTFSDDDILLNPLYKYATTIFEDASTLHDQSISIAKHLYERSIHPNIKSGDLIVSLVKEVMIDDEIVDAICIFKSELKDAFLQLKNNEGHFAIDYDKGINIEKLDKGAIILNTEKEDGYKICVIDRSNRFKEAMYWKDEFLKVKSRSDNYHATKNFIQMTKSFVKDRLKPLDEVDQADVAGIMHRSKEFFKHQESFEQDNYEKFILQNEEYVADFQEYKLDYQSERSVELPEEFDISQEAFKKSSRVFRSVIKLDKNFHIYVHGNRNMIEKGEETDGRKFYKMYYEKES